VNMGVGGGGVVVMGGSREKNSEHGVCVVGWWVWRLLVDSTCPHSHRITLIGDCQRHQKTLAVFPFKSALPRRRLRWSSELWPGRERPASASRHHPKPSAFVSGLAESFVLLVLFFFSGRAPPFDQERTDPSLTR
jgi:hypothetical protein